ncbi:MAG: PcfJ domain-containing protein [Hyphomicrobiaceae bacterium]
MAARSLLGRKECVRGVVVEQRSTEPEALARRFHADVRKEARRLMRSSSRVVDLAVIFPGALHAIIDPSIAGAQRDRALKLVMEGAQLKHVAAELGLPAWLRRLPPEAFAGAIPPLPQSDTFARRIVNCMPPSRAASGLWLKTISFVAEAAHEDFAVWLANQSLFGDEGDGDPRRMFAVLAAYAWFSGQPFKPAHGLMIVPWRPEISFETALCAAKSWLNRIRLTLQLGPGVIQDCWLDRGECMGLMFTPLMNAEDLLDEAQGMHNCADQYADRIARDRCRLWSVRRRNGQRLATLEIGQHPHEPSVLAIIQLKSRHNLPAPLEVWQAAHQWMAGQKGLRRAPPLAVPSRPPDIAAWNSLMRPYRTRKGGAPWLPANLSLPALGALDVEMSALARRAGVSSWLFT